MKSLKVNSSISTAYCTQLVNIGEGGGEVWGEAGKLGGEASLPTQLKPALFCTTFENSDRKFLNFVLFLKVLHKMYKCLLLCC